MSVDICPTPFVFSQTMVHGVQKQNYLQMYKRKIKLRRVEQLSF